MSMNIKNIDIKTDENAVATVNITIPKESVEKNLNKTINKYIKKVVMPGFRKGKAPRNRVATMYKEDIESDAIDELVNNAFKEILEEEKVKMYINSKPRITKIDHELDKDKDFNFTLQLEVAPEVNITDYHNLAYEKIVFKYTEEDVEEKLKALQEAEAMYVPKEDKPAEKDDKVIVEYSYFLIGRLTEEPDGKMDFIIGREGINPIFQEIMNTLEGKKVGYENTFDTIIPPDYENKNLAGKEGKIHIKIVEVSEKKVPEIDDEFAKDLEYDNLEELKKEIEKELQNECDKLTTEVNSGKIIEKLMEESEFLISKIIVEDEAQHQKENFLSIFGGNNEEELKELLERDDEETNNLNNKLFAGTAEALIKKELVTSTIIENEKLECTKEELESKIKDYADNFGVSIEKIKKELEIRDSIFELKRGIESDKLNRYLLENSNAISEKEKTLKEYEKEQQQEKEQQVEQ